jgi:hypothetical protein
MPLGYGHALLAAADILGYDIATVDYHERMIIVTTHGKAIVEKDFRKLLHHTGEMMVEALDGMPSKTYIWCKKCNTGWIERPPGRSRCLRCRDELVIDSEFADSSKSLLRWVPSAPPSDPLKQEYAKLTALPGCEYTKEEALEQMEWIAVCELKSRAYPYGLVDYDGKEHWGRAYYLLDKFKTLHEAKKHYGKVLGDWGPRWPDGTHKKPWPMTRKGFPLIPASHIRKVCPEYISLLRG